MPFDALNDVPDEALLVLYANGDPAAARALAQRFGGRVFGFAARMLADRAEAEDVAQEAMLRLWRIAPEWRAGEARVATWLYRVTANLCLDRFAARAPFGARRCARGRGRARPVEARLIEADRAAALEQALAALPPRQRQAVVLRHLEGLGNPRLPR